QGVVTSTLSDTDSLTRFTQVILASCPGAAGLGIGTFNDAKAAETALVNATAGQVIAPMGRAMGAGICSSTTTDKAEGLVVGLDGIVVEANVNSLPACGGDSGLNFSGTISTSTVNPMNPVSYTFTDWKDVLRVLYAGMDHNAGSAIANRNCASDLRKALAN